jgi:hypothetical protein
MFVCEESHVAYLARCHLLHIVVADWTFLNPNRLNIDSGFCSGEIHRRGRGGEERSIGEVVEMLICGLVSAIVRVD